MENLEQFLDFRFYTPSLLELKLLTSHGEIWISDFTLL